MKIVKNTLFVWLLCVAAPVISQDFQQDYLSAKDFFNEGKYKLAQEAFKPLIRRDYNNPFSSYASFYYAVSAYRDGYPALAKDMFLQIKQLYPKWSRIDEVNYWLGQIYFENKAYDLGIDALRDIRSKPIIDDVSKLKKHFFSSLEDHDLLVELYQTYPSDKELAFALAAHITEQPLVNRDHDLLKEIIDRFKFTSEDFNVVAITETVFKEEYKVAMLYPFMVKDLEPNGRKKFNQFVLDIYQGVELAVDSLKSKGIKLKLYTYDTRRNREVTEKILERDELKGMDLIIGPFSAKLTSIVNQFSFDNRINVINPLRTDSEVIGNNPYSFLYKPSNETIGRRLGDYVVKNIERKPGIIFYGESKSDSILAHAYKERVEKDSFNIIITKRVKKGSTREILDMLLVSDKKLSQASTDEVKERYLIAPDSISHIFVASASDLISSKVISAVETRGDSVKVIGPAEWLELSLLDYDVFKRLDVTLFAPVYKIKDSEAYKTFRKDYIRKHKVAPNKYVEIGYDLMMLVGNALHEHGKYFQIGWNDKELLEGCLTIGHRFKFSNDNHIIPVLTFQEGGVKIFYEIEDDTYAFQKQ